MGNDKEKLGYFDAKIEDLGESVKEIKQEIKSGRQVHAEEHRQIRKWIYGISLILTLQLVGLEGPEILGFAVSAAQALPW